ncbi:MAG: hypothetical protein PGN09_04780 [Sphingomonas fennica]
MRGQEGRNRDRVVAVGLLTQADLDVLGQGFRRAYPVGEDTDFSMLLAAIDEADRRSRANAAPHRA